MINSILHIYYNIDLLQSKYKKVTLENEYIRVYDEENVEDIVEYLFENSHIITEIKKNKIGLEEYYLELMKDKEVK